MIIPIILLFLHTYQTESICPKTWSIYSDKNEGPFKSRRNNRYYIDRTTEYRCERNSLQLNTSRTLSDFSEKSVEYVRGFMSCSDDCIEHWVNITVSYRNLIGFSSFDTFRYLVKNCDRLFWTRWRLTGDCSRSRFQLLTRQCVDCDEEVFSDQRYCPGTTNLTKLCQPFWSKWVIGNCSSTECNSTGERIRTRKCLYGDNSEENNTRLCSNQSAIITEQCDANVTNCIVASNQTTVHIHTIIGVTVGSVIFVLILIAFVALVKRKHTKSETALAENNERVYQSVTNHSQPVLGAFENVNRVNNKQNEPKPSQQVVYVNNVYSDNEEASITNQINQVYDMADDVAVKEKINQNAYNQLQINHVKTEEDYDKLRIEGVNTSANSQENEYNNLQSVNDNQSDITNAQVYNVLKQ